MIHLFDLEGSSAETKKLISSDRLPMKKSADIYFFENESLAQPSVP